MTTLMRLGALALAAFVLQTPATEQGFTQLFNGKDWTGWKVANPAAFRIENGEIIANGTPGHAYYDGPLLNHTFRDFELKVDVMTKPNSNGGIFILTEFQESGWPSKGFEIQVNNTYTKDPIKTGSLYQIVNINEQLAKDNEWFTEHIIVKGDTITVRVNDKQVVEWQQTPESKRKISPGTIALQAHDANSTVHYKNIRIKPL